MNNNNLTPLNYHKRNVLSLLLCSAVIVVSFFFESDNIWAKVPVWATGILAVILFFQYKHINKTEEYQSILDKGTSKAYWCVVYFVVILNPLMQIPNMANEIGLYPNFLKNYVLIQLGLVVFIREMILLNLCKKNNIS